jgi:DNA-binding SARP family transcriptional activator
MPDFKLLGPMEMVDDRGNSHIPAGPKVRQVLALLALNAGKIVAVDLFIRELWSENEPKDAAKTLQTHIYHLRRILLGMGPAVARLVERAAAHHRAGDHEAADLVLRKALSMWSGPPLADVPRGAVLGPRAIALDEQRLRAVEMHLETRIRLGLHGELIDELRVLVAAYPLNENFHTQLITALGRAGRRADAWRAYEGLRALLEAELGVEPAFDLQNLHLTAPTGSHSGKEVC